MNKCRAKVKPFRFRYWTTHLLVFLHCANNQMRCLSCLIIYILMLCSQNINLYILSVSIFVMCSKSNIYSSRKYLQHKHPMGFSVLMMRNSLATIIMSILIVFVDLIQKLMWKLNKSIVKEMLPTQPVDFRMEPWWVVCFVNLTTDEYRVNIEKTLCLDLNFLLFLTV